MMILTDEEMMEVIVDKPDETLLEFARAIEAAILAKLASAELPEPVGAYEKVVGTEIWQGFPSEIVEMQDAYSAEQLRQAYAQGAAAQLDRLEKAEKDSERCKRFIDEVCEETFDTWTNGYRMQQVAMNIKAAMEASK